MIMMLWWCYDILWTFNLIKLSDWNDGPHDEDEVDEGHDHHVQDNENDRNV